eukprot:scaffold2161_cov57-Attheya_sp.AAC.3
MEATRKRHRKLSTYLRLYIVYHSYIRCSTYVFYRTGYPTISALVTLNTLTYDFWGVGFCIVQELANEMGFLWVPVHDEPASIGTRNTVV